MLPHIEAPSIAGSAVARFGPIVVKNVLNLLAMIDVSHHCIQNALVIHLDTFSYFVTVFKTFHLLFASPLFATNNEE